MSSFTLDFLRSPAVSMKTYSLPFHSTSVSIASLVVPAMLDTITLLSPVNLLIIDDFPTFGLPTMATLGLSSSYSSRFKALKCSTTLSNISPRPLFCDAEIGTGSPIPRL